MHNGKTHHRMAIDTGSAMKFKYNDVASCLSILPTCHLLPDLTQNISLSFPFYSPSFSPSLCLPLSFFLCLMLKFPLKQSVVQQLDSSGWRQSGCTGGSPHPSSGPQLHQPHHGGSLQRTQGRTCSVSTHPRNHQAPNKPQWLAHYGFAPAYHEVKMCHLGELKA